METCRDTKVDLKRRKSDLKSRMDFWAGVVRPRSYVRTSPSLPGDAQQYKEKNTYPRADLDRKESDLGEQDGLLGRSFPAAVLR